MTITIRTLADSDLAAADAILSAAYRTPSRWDELRRYLALQPDGWLFAVRDDQPLGVGGMLDYGPLAYIGLIAVLPDAQRQGIGRAIMERLLALLDERGCPIALLDASPAGAPLYATLGFVEDDRTLVFQKDDCTQRPTPSEQVRVLNAGDLDALVAFDTPIFGADRRRVFADIVQRWPGRAFVARNAAGAIEGYLFAQERNLGPWAAQTSQAAEGLLAAAFTLEFPDGMRVLVPGSNPAATEVLLSYGFSPQRSLKHMRRGGTTHPGNRQLLYGQTSLAIG